MANEFRALWEKRTGYKVPFYGANSEMGTILQPEIHRRMAESMFTLSFKAIETWGQMVNESMLIGTPVILAEEFITGTFQEYELNPDTAIIKRREETVEQLVDRILSMSYEEYETLCIQAKTISEMFTAEAPRRAQLKWLFSKIPE
jgi:glycosyltransferase involved in cell wall biosynthesis